MSRLSEVAAFLSALSIHVELGKFYISGIGGSGRSSASKLAAFMGDYDLYQIEVTKNYNFDEWREDLQKIFKQTGVLGIPTTFLFGDHQIRVSL